MNNILSDARSVYIDSNVIIYFIEGYPELQDNVDRLFELAQNRNIRLVTSELTIGECLYGAYRDDHPELAARYGELFDNNEVLELVSTGRGIFERAAEIGAPNRRFKIIDAVHVATAIAEGCDAFVTNDAGIKNIAELRVVQLSEL